MLRRPNPITVVDNSYMCALQQSVTKITTLRDRRLSSWVLPSALLIEGRVQHPRQPHPRRRQTILYDRDIQLEVFLA